MPLAHRRCKGVGYSAESVKFRFAQPVVYNAMQVEEARRWERKMEALSVVGSVRFDARGDAIGIMVDVPI